MNTTYLVTAVLLSAAATLFWRALPYLAFRDGKLPAVLAGLGPILPAAVMAVLVVYCLKGAVTDPAGQALPLMAASVLTVVSYRLFRRQMVSIVLGTALYMVLLRVI